MFLKSVKNDEVYQNMDKEEYCGVLLDWQTKPTHENMPPKKSNKDLLLLKLKRQASTYLVECTPNDSLGELKQRLTRMINSTNGLKVNDEPISLDVQDSINLPEHTSCVPVPKIGLNDTDSDAEAEGEEDVDFDDNKSTATEINDALNVQTTADIIKIGKFENSSDIYGSKIMEHNEPDETKLKEMDLQDFVSLAFKLEGEEFRIYKPQYD